MTRVLDITVNPYGVMQALTCDEANSAHWDYILGISERFSGEWVLDKGHLVPKKMGKKDNPAYLRVIQTEKPEPAEQAAIILEFRNITEAIWVRKIESTESQRREPIDDAMVQAIGKYVRWVPRSGGSASLVVRSSSNTWTPCLDPWTELTYYYPNGETDQDGVPQADALAYLSHEVETLQKDGKTNWGVSSSVDVMTGRNTRNYTPFLAAARFKTDTTPRLTDTLISDIRLVMKEPVTFSNDINTPCLSFFPLKNLEAHRGGECRHWINFENQLPEEYRETWRAQFYGVFNDRNRSRQITLLVDQGQTGKSSVFRAIMQVAKGKFVSTQSKDSSANQFWASAVYGSRLVLFPDTGNTKVTMMTKIKQLTGGDPIPVEYKGQTPFTWVPNVRIWSSSNSLPEIDTLLKHQRSRMLVFPLTPTEDPYVLAEFCDHHYEEGNPEPVIHKDRYGDPINLGYNYDAVLADEFWPYLALCEESYRHLCKNDQDIPVPPAMESYIAGGCRAEATTALSALLDNFLLIGRRGVMVSNKQLRALIKHVAEEGKETVLKYAEVKKYLKGRGCRDFHDGTIRGLEGVGFRVGVSVSGDTVRIEGQTPEPPPAKPAAKLAAMGGVK